MSADANISVNLTQLEEQGYTIVRDFLTREQTARMREHMDSLIDPPKPLSETGIRRVNGLRNPIPGDIMPEFAANHRLHNIASQILHTTPDDMYMLEQVLIRTDPIDPAELEPDHKLGWHVDNVFASRHYDARPRQIYFQCVHLLNDVPTGRANTWVVPGSHKLTCALGDRLNDEEQLKNAKADAIKNAGINLDDGIELTGNEGDLVIFNPMCALHAGSPNRTDTPRYVYFNSFMDKTAVDLANRIRDMKYHGEGFEPEYRNALPERFRHFVDWYLKSA